MSISSVSYRVFVTAMNVPGNVPSGSKISHSINRTVPSIVEDFRKIFVIQLFSNLSIPTYHLPFTVIEFLFKPLLRQRIYSFQGSACRKIFSYHPLSQATKVSKMVGRGYAPLASPHSFRNLRPRMK